MEYYAALKSNAAVIHAIIWVNLDIMLGKSSWSQKTTCCMIPYEMPRISKFIDTESRLKVVRGWEEGRMRSDYKWAKVSFKEDKNFLKLSHRDGCTTL